MLREDRSPPLRDLANRVIPRDPGPLTASFRTGPAQRVLQAVRGIDAVQIWAHLGTKPTLREGMIGVPVEANRAAIPHLDQSGAGVRAIMRASATDELGVG